MINTSEVRAEVQVILDAWKERGWNQHGSIYAPDDLATKTLPAVLDELDAARTLVEALRRSLIDELGIGATRVCLCGADWTQGEACAPGCIIGRGEGVRHA